MSIGLNALISASRCRLSLFTNRPEQWILSNSLQYTARRFRSGKYSRSSGRTDFPPPSSFSSKKKKGSVFERSRIKLNLGDTTGIIKYFEENVRKWSYWNELHDRLKSFGIPEDDIQPLLRLFVSQVHSGKLSTHNAFNKYTLDRFARSTLEDLPNAYADTVYTRILYAWAVDPSNEASVTQVIQPSTLVSMKRLYQAASMEHPADMYIDARRARRKVIMHVGPTNSGKTYHALRALAAAPSGVYAGPLRLLAHEIWERLNLGQIIPAGVEEEEPVPATTDTALDVAPLDTAPAVQRYGNPKYARACNMITGEEHKIVSEEATLESATVEMLSMSRKYDVAVIDEIQMIADIERGYAWTAAVLGINAKELHLCGEETAIPIVQALLAETHDELIIHRYERLTPLNIGEALGSNWKKVEKGDCIVTFSRQNIFAVKEAVEKATKLRCAVVYGKLPPEIRSAQAELFNDPDSGYDVIIGSDAIGMGLNLKIRRIIFEAVSKFDGETMRPLSISQTKQIAGRAGRFGMVQETGGLATTFVPQDLPFLQKALETPFSPLPAAVLSPGLHTCQKIAQALPPTASLKAVFDAHVYVAQLKPHYRYCTGGNFHRAIKLVDDLNDKLTLEDRLAFIMAPMPWNEPQNLEVVEKLFRFYTEDLSVPFEPLFSDTSFFATVRAVEEKMATLPSPKSDGHTLHILEMFHKLLVLYAWLALRNPVVYYQPEGVEEWKPRVERALHWALQGITRFSTKRPKPPPSKPTRKFDFMSVGDLRKKNLEQEELKKEKMRRSVPVQA